MTPPPPDRSDSDLRTSVADGVLTLTLSRPDALNALRPGTVVALCEALEGCVADPAVRAVVITGSGGSFSAGADIGPSTAAGDFDVRAMDVTNRLIRAVVACDRPVVAAVRGPAVGVACGLALACDLVLAAEDATFLLPFSRIGLMPDGGSSASAAASIGRARAMRMVLLAEPLTGAEALAAGLVTHLVDVEGFDDALARLTRRLTAAAPLGMAAAKRAVNAATLPHLGDALERERTGQTILFGTGDFVEGLAAFVERRRAVFTGE